VPRTKPQRQCGSCAYWYKWPDGRGLCDKLDCAGKAEHGRGCPHWKGKKYNRHNAERLRSPASGDKQDALVGRKSQEERI